MTRRLNQLRKSSGQPTPTVHYLPVTRGVNRDVCEVLRTALRSTGEAPVRREWTHKSRRRAGVAREREACEFRRCQSRADCTSDALLQHLPRIPDPLRDALAIHPLQQRNGDFAGEAEVLFE